MWKEEREKKGERCQDSGPSLKKGRRKNDKKNDTPYALEAVTKGHGTKEVWYSNWQGGTEVAGQMWGYARKPTRQQLSSKKKTLGCTGTETKSPMFKKMVQTEEKLRRTRENQTWSKKGPGLRLGEFARAS